MQICIGEIATIGNVEQTRVSLLDAISDHSEIEIDIAEISEVDIGFVQLIEAARKHASDRSKSLSLAAPANPVVTALLERGGFLGAADADFLTFWFHGERDQ